MRGEEYKCDIQLLLFCCTNFFLVNNMNTHQRYMRYRKDELYHYNHNHDPKDGKFTSGPKGIVSKVKSALRKLDGQDYLDEIKARKDAEGVAVRPSTHEEELQSLYELEEEAERERLKEQYGDGTNDAARSRVKELHDTANKLVSEPDYYNIHTGKYNLDKEKQVARALIEANRINNLNDRGSAENHLDPRMEGKHLLISAKRLSINAARDAKRMISDPANTTDEEKDQYFSDYDFAESVKRKGDALVKYTDYMPDRPYYNRELEERVNKEYSETDPEKVHLQFFKVVYKEPKQRHNN